MEDELRTRMARALEAQTEAVFFPTNARMAYERPAPPLTLATLERAIDAVTTDRRTLLVRELRPLRRAMAAHGWEVVRVVGERGYWLRRTSGPAWRIKVYRSDYLPHDVVYVVDPDAAVATRVVAVGELSTTVTALALAGVDERVGP